MRDAWRSWGWACTLLVLLPVVAYLPALQCGFIWDDDDHLTNNPAMRSVDGSKQIWSSLKASRYYPLTLTSFWVQHRLWGLRPLPYHAVNIALHACNAVLILLLLRRLQVPGAWAAAALWALHPVCVESVAWVTELKNTQSALFFFLALLYYLRFDGQPRCGTYALTLICGLAAMLSKPSTVVLPAVFLLFVWWRRGRWRWSDGLRTAPFFAFALGMSALTIIEQRGHIRGGGPYEILHPPERFLLAGKAVWFYLGKLFWPADLMFIYPRWKLDPAVLMDWVPLVAAIVAAATLWSFHRRPWARAGLLGLGYFGLLLLPVSGLFDIFFFRYSFVADHFQYLACIGPIALVASAGTAACKRAGQQGGQYPGMLTVAAVLIMLAVATWKQERVYESLQTLWQDTVAKNPDAWMAHNNLGVLLAGEGKRQEAIGHYEQALRINPDYSDAHNNLGVALEQVGRLEDALGHYEQALRIKPDYATAHDNLGSVLYKLGRVQEAIGHFEQVLQTRPNNAEAHNGMGIALTDLGRVQEAIGHFEQALQIKPDYAEAHDGLGIALALVGRVQEAIGHFEQALRIKPDFAEAHYNLGVVVEQVGRVQEAMDHYEQTLRIKPDDVQAQNRLARLRAAQ